jgi:hypothetical protein
VTGRRRVAFVALWAVLVGVLGLGTVADAFSDRGWDRRGSYVPCMYAPVHPDDVPLEQGPGDSAWSLFPLGVTCGWAGLSRQAETSNVSWVGSAQLGLGGLLVLGSLGVLSRVAIAGARRLRDRAAG